ncbi:MAG: TonB-dependent receptor [Leptospiraceae bacterium]|nr:TonB-dependent receptor [Leptospiraceae bacterium]
MGPLPNQWGRLGAQNSLRVQLQLLEAPGGQPLANARVIVAETRSSQRSAADGTVDLLLPGPGRYLIRVIVGSRLEQQRIAAAYDGQKIRILFGQSEAETQTPKQKSDLENADPQDQNDSYTTSGQIRVFGSRDATRLSRHRLSQSDIRRLPGAYGDSLRGIESLPGVSRAPSVGVGPSSNINFQNFIDFGVTIGPPYSNSVGSGYLVIRGGGPRSSRVFLDGIPVYYPYHLGDQSSVINNDFIESVDVYTGSFPVLYGNSTGGIIALNSAEEVKKPGGHINIALFLSDVYFEMPLSQNSFAIATARKSYPNVLLLKAVPDAVPDNAQFADYADGQFKILWRLAPRHSLMFLSLAARDLLNYTKSVDELDGSDGDLLSLLGFVQNPGNTNTDGRPPVGLDRRFVSQGLRYEASAGAVFQNRLTISASHFREDFELRFDSPATGESIFDFFVEDERTESILRNESQMALWQNHVILKIGAETWLYDWHIGLRDLTPRQTNNTLTEAFDDIINSLLDTSPAFRALYDRDANTFFTNAAWAELEMQFWRLRLVPAVRSDYWSLSGSRGVGPRLMLEFAIPETGTTLLAAASRHFSLPLEQNVLSRQAGNPHLAMETADHAAVGIDQQFGREWSLKLEGYRKQFQDLVVADDFIVEPWSLRTHPRDLAENSSAIALDPFENRYLEWSNDGTGESYGFELLIKKVRASETAGFFGWISYTLSFTKRNNHQPRLSEEANNLRLSKRNNNRVMAYLETDPWTTLIYDTGEMDVYYDNDRPELYDYDRTHQVSLVLGYSFNSRWQLGLRYVYLSNTPITPIQDDEDLGNAGGFNVYFPVYSEFYNSTRLDPYHQLDLRLDHFERYQWGYANYFVELINVYARENAIEESWNYQQPYRRHTNPSIRREANIIRYGGSDGPPGPLINVGMEIKF